MGFCKITAIIRSERLQDVEARLQEIGVHACSVTVVTGCGEYADYFKKNHMTQHARIEIFAPDERSEHIARAVMEAAHVGMPGDGIVAILPVQRLFRIRSKAEAGADDVC